MSATPIRPAEGERPTHKHGRIDDIHLNATIAQVLDSWPCAGLAVAVIADGSLSWFHGHGLADIAAKKPIQGFRGPVWSAIEPNTGDRMAMTKPAIAMP